MIFHHQAHRRVLWLTSSWCSTRQCCRGQCCVVWYVHRSVRTVRRPFHSPKCHLRVPLKWPVYLKKIVATHAIAIGERGNVTVTVSNDALIAFESTRVKVLLDVSGELEIVQEQAGATLCCAKAGIAPITVAAGVGCLSTVTFTLGMAKGAPPFVDYKMKVRFGCTCMHSYQLRVGYANV
jgi:hypothetical protein